MSIPEFDKPDMKTDDLTALNEERIGKLFPQVIVEKKGEDGEIKKGIDFDALRTILSGEIVDDERERYRLDWPGKKASLVKANTPITDTLRPDRAESVDWEHTENVFIEGDNFKALKILQESYLGQVKMIYIDPPYNTGKDFVYSDKFTMDKDEYEEAIGQHDEEDNKLFKENTKTNPRYHSDWLSMMYERLVIARDLLREDGVIFISIDDNEVHNLRKVCDEIFGEENFIANVVWQSRTSISNDELISMNHNHTLIFSKDKSSLSFRGDELVEKEYTNPDNDPRGPWKLVPLDANKPGGDTKYEIINPRVSHRRW